MIKLFQFKGEELTKVEVGHFILSDDKKRILFYPVLRQGGFLSQEEFIKRFGTEFINQKGQIIKLDDPVKYYNNLIYRWSGIRWCEKKEL